MKHMSTHHIKHVLAFLLLACLGLTLAAAPVFGQDDEVALETEDQKILYTLGRALAENLQQFNLDEESLTYVLAGVEDRALERESRVDEGEFRQKLNTFAQKKIAEAVDKEKIASQAFVEKMAQEEGAQVMDSGLVFFELKAGDGESPSAEDNVTVHYHGTLRSGEVFDSSVERGQPASFALNRVIPCWTEGVQKLKVGGKARLVCPPAIAYGDRGAPPKILPGAALVFEVELIGIGQ